MLHFNRQIAEAVQNGYRAGAAGLSRDANRYWADTPLWTAWNNAYDMALEKSPKNVLDTSPAMGRVQAELEEITGLLTELALDLKTVKDGATLAWAAKP